MNKHFQVGVTGGIGAGKSVVTKIFSVLGIPIYDSDSRAKYLMNSNNELRELIIVEFGAKSFEDGRLNREYLAGYVFTDPEKLEKLNRLVHPKVGEDYSEWLGKQSSSITIKEAALLFETGIASQLDHLVLVVAPDELRIKRVKARDDRSEDQIRDIMRRQWPQDKTKKLANSIIINDEEKALIPQIIECLEDIKRKAGLC